jgi:hypothetical protein
VATKKVKDVMLWTLKESLWWQQLLQKIDIPGLKKDVSQQQFLLLTCQTSYLMSIEPPPVVRHSNQPDNA